MKDNIGIFGKVSTLRIFKAFHYRNFSLLFVSTIIMSVSNFMMMVALGWLVLEITDSPLSLGILWASRSAPHFIWGLLAGAVADKVDRRNLLIWAFVMLAACAFAMGFTISNGWIELWYILLFSFVMGSISTFTMTARQAFVVDIVSRDDAMSAISMNSVAMRIMGVFGGIASGVMIGQFGIYWPFYTMAVCYIAGVIILLFIQGVTRDISSKSQSIRGNLVDSLKIIGKNQIVLILVVMAIICEILGFSYHVLLPVFARDILEIGVVGLGILSATQSAGGLLAALSLASLGNYRRKGWLILCIFLFFGIFLVLFAQSPWYHVSLVLCGLVGAMAAAFDAMQHTMLQLNVADEQRGRAMGIWQLSIGFGPIGSLIVGALAGLLGAQLTLSINGIAIILIFFLLVPFARKLHRA